MAFYSRWKNFDGDPYAQDKFDKKLNNVSEVKRKLQKIPEEFYTYTGLPVIIPSNFTPWLAEVVQDNSVMLQELMSGSGRLSLSCYMAGQMVGCPMDCRYEWNLQRPEHQHLIDNIKSTVDFAAPNCGPWICLSCFHREGTKDHTRLSEQSTLKWLAKRTIQRHHRHGTATIM